MSLVARNICTTYTQSLDKEKIIIHPKPQKNHEKNRKQQKKKESKNGLSSDSDSRAELGKAMGKANGSNLRHNNNNRQYYSFVIDLADANSKRCIKRQKGAPPSSL